MLAHVRPAQSSSVHATCKHAWKTPSKQQTRRALHLVNSGPFYCYFFFSFLPFGRRRCKSFAQTWSSWWCPSRGNNICVLQHHARTCNGLWFVLLVVWFPLLSRSHSLFLIVLRSFYVICQISNIALTQCHSLGQTKMGKKRACCIDRAECKRFVWVGDRVLVFFYSSLSVT